MQNYFHYNTKMLFLFFNSINTYTDDAKVMVSKTAGTLAEVKAEAPKAPNWTRNHIFFTTKHL